MTLLTETMGTGGLKTSIPFYFIHISQCDSNYLKDYGGSTALLPTLSLY